MGNKILTVEINADTGKFEAKLKELPTLISKQADAAKLIKQLDEQRTIVLQKNASAIQDAYEKIRNTTEKVKELNSAFQLGAMNASLVSVNKNLSDMSKQLSEIAAKRKALDEVRQAQNMASTLGTLTTDEIYNRRSGPYRPSQQFGTVAESRLRFEKEANEAYANLIKQTQEEITSKEKEELRKQEFAAKASYNARYQMYAAMFDQIEEKRKRTDFSALGQNIFRPKSDTAIRLTQGLSEAGRLAEMQKQIPAHKELIDTQVQAEKQVKALKDANKDLEKSHRTLFESVISSTVIYKTFTSVLHGIKQVLLDIPRAGIEAQATQASILGIFGSEQGLANLKFIREEAQFAGQNIKILEESYRRFAPSAILAGEEQDKVNKTFKDFSETAAILHLSEQQVNSLFLALDQMYAKGVVQSEEIKKQLGNVLPGAVEIAARAFGKTPSAFMEAMKKNEVVAKSFIPKFAALYREIFGGPDDKVFTTVQDQLNANLERIKTNYTLLTRDIFGQTSSILNTSAKQIGSALESIRNNLTGLSQVVELSSYLLVGRFALATAEFIGNTGKISIAIEKFTRLVTGMPLVFNASIGSLVAYYGYLNELTIKYDEASGFTVTFQDKTVSLTSYVKSLAIITFEEFKEAVAGLTAELKILSSVDLTSFWDSIIPNKNDIAEFLGYINVIKNAIPSANGMRLTQPVSDEEAFEKARTEFLNRLTNKQTKIMEEAGKADALKYAESFAGKSALEVSKAIAEGKLTTTEQITKALEKTIDINAPKIAFGSENIPETKGKKGTAAARRRELNEESKLENAELKLALEQQQTLYNSNIISYARYFEERKAILEKAIKEEQALNRGKQGQAKVLDYEKQIEQLQQDRFTAAISKAQELRSIDQEYYQIIGDSEKALTSQQQEKYALILNYLREQVELGNEAANEGIRRVNIINSIAKAEASVADARQQSQAKETQYQQALERINILKNTGALSELQANREIDKQNEQIIRSREEAIAAEEKVLEVLDKVRDSSAYRKKAEEIRQMRAELENFKLTANTTAQFIENTLGKAFENAFVDFATGTVNATQAFQNFTKSIIAEIAKLAAQEARSAIVGGLLKSAFSGIMGMFGSGLSTVIPKTVGLNLGSSLNLSPIMQATGGINTGMGIGNGVVLSSATYFPQAKPTMFASGGVVAGEAGYEAALPLKRTRSGKLGVSVEGQQQAGNVVNINVSVDRSKGQNDEAYAAMIAEKIARKVSQEEIAKNARNKTYSSSATKYG